jgi:hypothetical protein
MLYQEKSGNPVDGIEPFFVQVFQSQKYGNQIVVTKLMYIMSPSHFKSDKLRRKITSWQRSYVEQSPNTSFMHHPGFSKFETVLKTLAGLLLIGDLSHKSLTKLDRTSR